MTKTKKLIEDLKEEIKKQYGYTKMQKLAQLQFAEKIMKLRDKEEKERYKKIIGLFKNRKVFHINKDMRNKIIVELNKILDEALK